MSFPTEPGALGHEGWGVVDAVGEGVEGLAAGDRVAALSFRSYADYDLADEAAVVKLPDALAASPFPGEPLGCAMNIFRRSAIEAGQDVAIVGIGFLGAILTRLATDAGARVIAISRRPFSLEVARAVRRRRDHPDGRSLGDHRAGEGPDRRPAVRPGDRGGRQAMAARSRRRARRASAAGWWSPAIIRTGPGRSTCRCGTGRGSTSSTPTSATRKSRCAGSARRWRRWLPAGSIRRRSTRISIRWSGSARPSTRPATGPTASSRPWSPWRARARPRLGFLGVGWIGRHRMEAMLATGAVDVAAIADPSPECAAEALALAPGAAAVEGLDGLIAAGVDGIVIATPSALHAEQSIRALESGAAVFCQKPLGRTAAETKAVVEAARTADRLLAVDLSYRFTEGVRRIRGPSRFRRARADLCRRSRLPQRLRPGQALVLRPRAFRRRLRHRPRGPSRRPGPVGARLPQGDGRRPASCSRAASRFGRGRPRIMPSRIWSWRAAHRVRLACSWRLPAGREAIISAAFYGTGGGASLRNVGGSFYDFEAELYRGTAAEILASPPDEWGGRAAADWAIVWRPATASIPGPAAGRRRPGARPDLRARSLASACPSFPHCPSAASG